MRNVFFVGELIADMVEAGMGSSKFESRFGGCSYFGCVAAARVARHNMHDDKIHFIGPVSKDSFGDRFLEELSDNSVSVETVVRTDRNTTLAMVVTSPGRENGFSFYEQDTTVRDIRPEEIRLPLLPGDAENVFVYGSVSTMWPGAREVLLEHARSVRDIGLIYFDLNARPIVLKQFPEYCALVDRWAAVADVVKASNFDIAAAYPGRAIRDVAAGWIEKGAKLAIVTFGNQGSWALRADSGKLKEYHVGCEVPLEAHYTVGAGDSFNAGVCSQLFRGNDLLMLRKGDYVHGSVAEALRAGNQSASMHLTANGAYPRPAQSRSADDPSHGPILTTNVPLPNLTGVSEDSRPARIDLRP